MIPLEKKIFTPEEYLVLERKSSIKNEYFQGEIFAMAGASEKHNTIVSNLLYRLRIKLEGKPCKVYPSDIRIKVNRNGLYTYPDITVICSKPILEDHLYDTLLNPKVIFEVLSDSSENYDRGKKFQLYREIDSLQEYVLVSQDSQLVEKYYRDNSYFWTFQDFTISSPIIKFQAIDCELNLLDIYESIEFSDFTNPMA